MGALPRRTKKTSGYEFFISFRPAVFFIFSRLIIRGYSIRGWALAKMNVLALLCFALGVAFFVFKKHKIEIEFLLPSCVGLWMACCFPFFARSPSFPPFSPF